MEAFFAGILRYTLASVLIFATVYQSGKQKCIFVPSVEREFFSIWSWLIPFSYFQRLSGLLNSQATQQFW